MVEDQHTQLRRNSMKYTLASAVKVDSNVMEIFIHQIETVFNDGIRLEYFKNISGIEYYGKNVKLAFLYVEEESTCSWCRFFFTCEGRDLYSNYLRLTEICKSLEDNLFVKGFSVLENVQYAEVDFCNRQFAEVWLTQQALEISERRYGGTLERLLESLEELEKRTIKDPNLAISCESIPTDVLQKAISEANERLPEWKYIQIDRDGHFHAATCLSVNRGTFLYYPQGKSVRLLTTWDLSNSFLLLNNDPLKPEKLDMSEEDCKLFSKMSPDARRKITEAIKNFQSNQGTK